MDKNERILRELAPEEQVNYIPIGRNSLQMGIVNRSLFAWAADMVYDFTQERIDNIANADICYMKVALNRELTNLSWHKINPSMKALSKSTERFEVLYTMPEIQEFDTIYKYFDGVIISDLIRGARMAMGSPYDLAVSVVPPNITRKILRYHETPVLSFCINYYLFGFLMPCSDANEKTAVYNLPTSKYKLFQ